MTSPIKIISKGNSIIFKNTANSQEHSQNLKELASRYPLLLNEVDTLIEEISVIVRENEPKNILLRSYWALARQLQGKDSEDQITSKETTAFRMLDYIQSIIASTAPLANQNPEISDKDWETLKSKVHLLFNKVSLEYPIYRSAKRIQEDPKIDLTFEEYEVEAINIWCNVRGERYQNHQEAYIRDVLSPHNDILQELFGISAEDLISGLKSILDSLTFGLFNALERYNEFKNRTLDEIVNYQGEKTDPAEVFKDIIISNGREKEHEQLFNRAFQFDLFDVEKNTNFPNSLLERLSWEPGEDLDFFAEGEYRGWPLRAWPVSKKPFLKIEDKYYCFDISSLFDNIYRVIQRIILELKPEYKEEWNKRQKEISETLPITYIQKTLPGLSKYSNLYYPYKNENGKTKWCECDSILIYQDTIFIIEAKGGAFSHTTSPAINFDKFIRPLKELVSKPSRQAERTLSYIKLNTESVFYDERKGKEILRIKQGEIKRIVPCAITLDPFTELAAQSQNLNSIGIDTGITPTWQISLDDLRVYSDIFNAPNKFLDYIDQRLLALTQKDIRLNDELDHLGLYLEHHNYSKYLNKLAKDSKLIGYRRRIDQFFHERLENPNTICNIFEKENTSVPKKKNKIGRNDPCPCGSGTKYKKCCLGKY